METKQPNFMQNRAETMIAALVVVVSVVAGSAVLAQDQSAKPATPPAADKAPAADKMGMGGGGMMGMGSDHGMSSGMRQMKDCGQDMSKDMSKDMGRADHGASDKQDEKSSGC